MCCIETGDLFGKTIILTQPTGHSAALAVVVLALIRQACEEALDLGTNPHLLTSQLWVGSDMFHLQSPYGQESPPL